MAPEVKLYGVYIGDGYNGVSHMYPDYYVRTANPWLLARAAACNYLNEGMWYELQEDGEAENTIVVWLDDCGDNAEFILEVSPVTEEEVQDRLVIYNSIAEAVSAEALAYAERAGL